MEETRHGNSNCIGKSSELSRQDFRDDLLKTRIVANKSLVMKLISHWIDS